MSGGGNTNKSLWQYNNFTCVRYIYVCTLKTFLVKVYSHQHGYLTYVWMFNFNLTLILIGVLVNYKILGNIGCSLHCKTYLYLKHIQPPSWVTELRRKMIQWMVIVIGKSTPRWCILGGKSINRNRFLKLSQFCLFFL